MNKQCITVQDGNGMPLGSLFVAPEGGIDNPLHWLKGTMRFAIAQDSIDLHVDLIGVSRDGGGNLVPLDPMFKDEVLAAYSHVGGEVPATVRINSHDYIVLIYPFAE